MNSKRRALVAGAGIAGLAAAAGLHQLDWEVHLVDRRSTFDAIPTGLFFPANGMRAFAALGVAGPLLSRGRVVERMRLRGTGCQGDSIAVLAEIWPGIGPSVAIHRGLAEDAMVLAQEVAAGPDIDEALARYASRRRPRTAHVQETTAMRNGLAALPLEDRVGFVVPRWAELSTASFAALVPTP